MGHEEAALISELANLRRLLWLLIAVCKQVVHRLPAVERTQLLKEMMSAENHLARKGVLHG